MTGTWHRNRCLSIVIKTHKETVVSMKKKMKASTAISLVFAALFLFSSVNSFYLPGIAPRDFQIGYTMIGSFITRVLAMVFGYAFPAYECYKAVEKNRPKIEQLRFWCQYWILVAVLTICERIGDTFISCAVMCVYSASFMRFAWVVRPRNLHLLVCHLTNETMQLYQLSRWIRAQRVEHSKEEANAE